jgi:RNase P/RNase MRP subunit p30
LRYPRLAFLSLQFEFHARQGESNSVVPSKGQKNYFLFFDKEQQKENSDVNIIRKEADNFAKEKLFRATAKAIRNPFGCCV